MLSSESLTSEKGHDLVFLRSRVVDAGTIRRGLKGSENGTDGKVDGRVIVGLKLTREKKMTPNSTDPRSN